MRFNDRVLKRTAEHIKKERDRERQRKKETERDRERERERTHMTTICA